MTSEGRSEPTVRAAIVVAVPGAPDHYRKPQARVERVMRSASGLLTAIRNGRTLVLLCEGACSRMYADRAEWINKLKAAGYSPDQVRAHISTEMESTAHREIEKIIDYSEKTVTSIFKCKTCGHRRVYGVEEL